MSRAFVDLHSHSRGSFDSLSSPKDMVKAAVDRGLTHLAITDHDRIDVAQEARGLAPDGLTVIVGEEVKTRDGDLICLFLETAIPPGLSAMETIAAAREQGGLVGIPHPFDRMRGSLLRDAAMASLAPTRGLGRGAQRARRGPRQRGCVGLRARAWAAGDRRLGRAFDHGDRGGVHRGRWRPVDAGRPPRRARPAGGHPRSGELLRPAVDAGGQGRQSPARQRPGRRRRRTP